MVEASNMNVVVSLVLVMLQSFMRRELVPDDERVSS